MRSSRSIAIAALLFGPAVLPPQSAAAQETQTRGWRVCVTSAIGSCSEFFLSTSASLSVAGDRVGTEVSVIVRHETAGPRVSALQSFTFYGVSTGGSADAVPKAITPEAINGAPEIDVGQTKRWAGRGMANEADRTDVFSNWLNLTSGVNPDDQQFIGGCAGGQIDDYVTTVATTCGDQAYGMSFKSNVWIDANDIARVAVDIYANDGNGDFFPDIATCNAPVDGTPGEGFDMGEPDFTAVCSVLPATTSVPEPPAWWLLATACAALAPLVVRNRRKQLWMGAVAAVLTLSACTSAEAPSAPLPPAAAPVVFSADLQAAVIDASERVVPAIDVERQPMLRSALAELQQALQAGQRVRAQRAVEQLDALVPLNDTSSADAADLSALRVLLEATRESLVTPQ